jgi:hypothetical protein
MCPSARQIEKNLCGLLMRSETGHPMIVQDSNYRVVGIVGDGELYRALLGKNLSAPAPFADEPSTLKTGTD